MRKKAYIAGKITGLDYNEVVDKFMKAEQKLLKAGFMVYNPVSLVPKNTDWEEAMRQCLHHLLVCDVVCLLPDWEQSEGAQLEELVARKTGKEVKLILDLKGLPTMNEIEAVVCRAYNTEPELLRTESRKNNIKECRQVCMVFLNVVLKLSLADAGAPYRRDHATVNAAKKTIKNFMETEKQFVDKIEKIALELNVETPKW